MLVVHHPVPWDDGDEVRGEGRADVSNADLLDVANCDLLFVVFVLEDEFYQHIDEEEALDASLQDVEDPDVVICVAAELLGIRLALLDIMAVGSPKGIQQRREDAEIYDERFEYLVVYVVR